MALAYLPISKTVPGGSVYSTVRLTGDATYPALGYNIDPTLLGLSANQVKSVIDIRPATVAAGAFVPVLTETVNLVSRTISLNLRLVVGTTGIEVATGASAVAAAFNLIIAGN